MKQHRGLSEHSIAEDPFVQFTLWFAEAVKHITGDVNEMCLATSTPDGKPSCRIVLLREVDYRGFVFYTNYDSRKGHEINANPYAAATFHWKEQERQVRISGRVRKVSRKESESYFLSRPPESRLSAAISPQSSVIPSRNFLEERKKEILAKYRDPEQIPCPENWGGFRIIPDEMEFWQGREHRLHDRILYTRKGKGWQVKRLAP